MVTSRQWFSDFLTNKSSQGNLFNMYSLGLLSSKKRIQLRKLRMESGICIFKRHKRVWRKIDSVLKKYYSKLFVFIFGDFRFLKNYFVTLQQKL